MVRSSLVARPSEARLPHLPALDGLRGVAVLAVFFFHAGHFPGGFLGVDLFFVLSGFLITSLLLVEHARHGTISLGAFWARRARRLLPALFLLLVGIAAYAVVVADPTALDKIRRDALGTIGYVANWVSIFAGTDYWGSFTEFSPLAHTWSLAIEEQFYVVWPLVLLGLLKLTRGSHRAVAWVFAVFAATSVALLQLLYVPGEDPRRVYFGTDTRAAALVFGALAAVAYVAQDAHRSKHVARAHHVLGHVVVGGAAAVIAAIWLGARGTSIWLYQWGLPLVGVAAAALILGLARGYAWPLARALSAQPLRHLGVVSYGFYLWHWPVMLVLTPDRTGLDGVALTGSRFLATLAASELSYHLVEHPVRRGALTGWPARVLTPVSVAVATVLVVVATAGDVDRPAPGTTLAAAPGTPLAAVGAPDVGMEVPTILVVGDSGAAYLGRGMAAVAAEHGVTVQSRGRIGCGLPRQGDGVRTGDGGFLADPDGCHDWEADWAGLVDAAAPRAALLVLGWPGIGDRQLAGEWRHPCEPEFDSYYRDEVVTAIDVLQARGAVALVAMTPPPASGGAAVERVACLNRVYREAVALRTGSGVVELEAWLCEPGPCQTEMEGVELRPDGVHFDGPGAEIAGRFVLSSIRAALEDRVPPKVLLLGDSTAYRLVTGGDGRVTLPFTLFESTGIGCGLMPGEHVDGDMVIDAPHCNGLLDTWSGIVAETQPDLVVVLGGAWEVLDHRVGDATVRFGTPQWEQAVTAALAGIADLPTFQTPVVLLTAPCYRQETDSLFPADSRNDSERVAGWNEIVRSVAASRPLTTVIDFGAFLCPGGDYIESRDGVVIRDDGVHLTPEGAVLAWNWLTPQLLEAIDGAGEPAVG